VWQRLASGGRLTGLSILAAAPAAVDDSQELRVVSEYCDLGAMSMNGGSTAEPDVSKERVVSAGTARLITRSLLIASYDRRYTPLIPAESTGLTRELLCATGDRWFVRAATSSAFRAACRCAAAICLPGIILHYIARKQCLEQWVHSVCDFGQNSADICRQIVMLGAGLDTLGWRLHRQAPALTILEVDRPAALRVKLTAMKGQFARQQNLTFIAADLGVESLTEALARAPAFKSGLPTLFLAEGLLMYLAPERVASLFREIAAFGRPGVPVYLAFTFMEEPTDGRIGFRHSSGLVDWWLRRKGEPFLWAHDPQKLAQFLEQKGLHLHELAAADTLRIRYLEPAGLPDARLAMGEWLAFAQTTATT
jgi:methyltransferase (TIGR00027 family)